MSERDFHPRRLDVRAFAKAAAELEGRWPVRQLDRLADSLHAESPSTDDEVVWRARGELRAMPGSPAQTWLHLKADTCLSLECQRCLQPVRMPLALDRRFLFVAGEEAAAQLDADSDDDVLALTRALDLQELVEDELLLALPLVPRHAQCPAPLLPAADPNDEAQDKADDKASPFAVLAALKDRGRLN